MSVAPKGWHRHANGGGLVQDTASVDSTAYVGRSARVSGSAQVYGSARVSGSAWVYGSARVYGSAWVESPPTMQVGRWCAFVPQVGRVSVGCQDYTLAEWDARFEEIAEKHGATDLERTLVEHFIALVRMTGLGGES